MRNAVLCVGAMLAMLLFWPTLFGGGSSSPARAAPVSSELAGLSDDDANRVRMNVPPALHSNPSCTHRYATQIVDCHKGRRCVAAVKTRRDLCEATGSWQD